MLLKIYFIEKKTLPWFTTPLNFKLQHYLIHIKHSVNLKLTLLKRKLYLVYNYILFIKNLLLRYLKLTISKRKLCIKLQHYLIHIKTFSHITFCNTYCIPLNAITFFNEYFTLKY